MKSVKILSIALAGMIFSFAQAEYPSGFKVGLGGSTHFGKFDIKVNIEAEDLLQDMQTVGKSLKKSKTSFSPSLFIGYDFALENALTLGLETEFGYNLKWTKFNDKNGNGALKLRKGAFVEATPKIGYFITQDIELFAKAGIDFARYNLKLNGATDNTLAKDHKNKVTFVAGAGVNYNLTQNFGLSLAYTHQFNKKIDTSTKCKEHRITLGTSAKYKEHRITLGAFYRF